MMSTTIFKLTNFKQTQMINHLSQQMERNFSRKELSDLSERINSQSSSIDTQITNLKLNSLARRENTTTFDKFSTYLRAYKPLIINLQNFCNEKPTTYKKALPDNRETASILAFLAQGHFEDKTFSLSEQLVFKNDCFFKL